MQVSGSIARSTLKEERAFFVGMGGAFVLFVLLGFGPSYFLRGRVTPYTPLFSLTPLIHFHALLFSSWVLLYVVQTALVATRRVGLHRRLGLAGALLAPLMVVVGTLTALHQAVRGSGPPSVPPLSWLAVPLFDMPAFAILVSLALRSRRKPQVHKRLMFIASVALMSAPVARIPVPSFLPELVVNVALPDFGLLALAAWDVRSRGKLHPVTAMAGGLLVAIQILRFEIAATGPWLRFAGWAVSLVA